LLVGDRVWRPGVPGAEPDRAVLAERSDARDRLRRRWLPRLLPPVHRSRRRAQRQLAADALRPAQRHAAALLAAAPGPRAELRAPRDPVRRSLASALVLLPVVACGGGTPAAPCDPQPGMRCSIAVGDRSVIMYVPASFVPGKGALVVAFHPLGRDGSLMEYL